MAIKQREYLFSVNDFKEPYKIEGKNAVAVSLIRIILLDPGSDPLHPGMGLGIKRYRYSTMDKLEDMRIELQNQIDTYLPMYAGAIINLKQKPGYICNIEITIGDTTYVYDENAPIPLTLSEVQNN